MTISLVQQGRQGFGGGLSITLSGTTAGNLLTVHANQNSTTFTISDTLANSWSKACSVTGSSSNNANGVIWYCITKGGNTTVTIGGTGISSGSTAWTIAEWSGVNTFDQAGMSLGAASTAGTTWTGSESITSSQSPYLVVGMVAIENAGSPTIGVNSPFTVIGLNETWYLGYYNIYTSAPSGVVASGVCGNGNSTTQWSSGIAGFYQASASHSDVVPMVGGGRNPRSSTYLMMRERDRELRRGSMAQRTLRGMRDQYRAGAMA